MMSFPLWRTTFLISSPCASKNPCLIPRSSGRVFAIGMMLTVIGTPALDLAVVAAAAPASSAATTTAATAASRIPRRRRG